MPSAASVRYWSCNDWKAPDERRHASPSNWPPGQTRKTDNFERLALFLTRGCFAPNIRLVPHPSSMSNMPAIHKSILGVRLPLELLARLRKLAEDRGVSVTALVQLILETELDRLGAGMDENVEKWIQEKRRINANRRHTGH